MNLKLQLEKWLLNTWVSNVMQYYARCQKKFIGFSFSAITLLASCVEVQKAVVYRPKIKD